MAFSSVLFCLGLSLSVLSANGSPIDFIEPCPINDDACTLTSAKKAMPHLVLGNKALGIESLDPITFQKIVGDIDTLKIAFDTLTVIGASKCKIIAVRRSEELKVYVEVDCPITANGQYVVGGELLGLPISGHGPFEFAASLIKIKVHIILAQVDGKDGEKHYKILKFDFNYDPVGDVSIVLKNLYDGDKKQAEPIENLIAKEPKHILNLVGKNVITEIIKKVVHAIGHFFNKATLAEINGQ